MGAAEIISCVEVRARKQGDTLRPHLHKRFAQGLATLAPQWHEPPSPFTEVTATVWDGRQQLPGGLTETIVAHVSRGAQDRTQGNGPRCADMWQAGELVCRTVAPQGGLQGEVF